ncbi:hypothetical protein HanRHA438_Chr01g0029451 [Helianthus annuus]|nr:hypothetical protein HanRHA438_Chr01g0029451 [Helianthus annuus]
MFCSTCLKNLRMTLLLRRKSVKICVLDELICGYNICYFVFFRCSNLGFFWPLC